MISSGEETGKYPVSGYQVFEFVYDNILASELRDFKLLSEEQILSAFCKWQRIIAIPRKKA